MTNSTIESDHLEQTEVIAGFGNATIIRWPDDRFEIRGGTTDERKQASQWAARFLDVRFSTRELIGA